MLEKDSAECKSEAVPPSDRGTKSDDSAWTVLRKMQGRPYLIGPAFLLTFLFWRHYRLGLPKLIGDLSSPDLTCLLWCTFLGVFLVASSFVSMERYRRSASVVASVCGVASVFCILLPGVFGVPQGALAVAGTVFYTVFSSIYSVLWVCMFGRQSVMAAIVGLLVSTALGLVLAWLVLGLDDVRACCALAGAIVLSTPFYLSGLKREAETCVSLEARKSAGQLPMGLIFISFAFAVSYMYTIVSNGLQMYHTLFSWDLFIAALAFLAIGFVLRKHLTVIRLFSLAAPLMVVGVLLTLFVDINSIVLFNLFNLGFYGYLVFTLVLYCGCVQERQADDLRLACSLLLGILAGCFVGRFLHPVLGSLFPSFAQESYTIGSVVIIGVLVVCAVYGSQCIYKLFGVKPLPLNIEASNDSGGQGLDVAQITELYGLSSRESEVLQLLLEGKSATQIAEEMVVAHGTIKAHTRNIYKKLGIHRREELFNLSAKGRV